MVTYSALQAYVDKITPSWLTSKGFVIGDGGSEIFNNVTFARKEFKPIILWQPSVKTDAAGVAKFSCETPDNLTKFRVIAVDSRGNIYTTETYTGKRLQRFLAKGMGAVPKSGQVPWPTTSSK